MQRMPIYDMAGHRVEAGRLLAQAGFLHAGLGEHGFSPGESRPIFSRVDGLSPESQKMIEELCQIQRGEAVGDLAAIVPMLGQTLRELTRGITTGTSAFPVRENLEAPASLIIPLDTPLRNLLPRVPGAGTATAWKQITSLGGGWGTGTNQPGGGSVIRMFFHESGSPAEHTTAYADKSAGYKLLGTFGSITGFAQAAGATYQEQRASEMTNSITNLMLNEEYALLHGDSASTAAPWGDGVLTLAFDGLMNLITTANGTPATQVQAAVGPLTMSHLNQQLIRTHNQGGRGAYMIVGSQESTSLVHLAEAAGSIIRVMGTVEGKVVLGVTVQSYAHPLTGEQVPIYYSRFMPDGTILFGSRQIADGRAAAEVSVLPQVSLPQLAPTQMIQGYTAQELAPTIAAAQTYPWVVTVYEVLKMRAATVFAKSSAITPA